MPVRKDSVKEIFISHSVKDAEIANAFVDIILHGALFIEIDKIYCISTDGIKIKSGDDWRESIREALLSSKIIFLIITPNYKESEVCLNEMGAAWISEARVIPVIVPPINYKTVGAIKEPSQIEKLLDDKAIDRIKDIISEELNLNQTRIKSDRWTGKKMEFLLKVRKHLENNPFSAPVDRESYNELISSQSDLENTVNNLIEEKIELEATISDLKKAKDKSEVTEIIKKRMPHSQFQEFQELCKKVKNILSRNAGIINGIIFKSYTRKSVKIFTDGNDSDLDEALANDFINEDLEIKWNDTDEMRNLSNALDDVSAFLSKSLKNDFYDSFEEEYPSINIENGLSNKKFWEEVFEAYLTFK